MFTRHQLSVDYEPGVQRKRKAMERNQYIWIVPALLIACSQAAEDRTQRDLTRTLAASLLEEYPEITELTTKLCLHQWAVEEAVEQGIFIRSKGLQGVGKEVFSKFPVYAPLGAVLANPVSTPAIEVTGIADAGDGIREVQFLWRYRDLPDLAKRFATSGGFGIARIRRFDDGWRVQEAVVNWRDDQRYPLSESESEAAERDKTNLKETEKRRKQEGARRKEESETATRSLGTFFYLDHNFHAQRIEITDAYLRSERQVARGEVPGEWVVMIRDVKSVSTDDCLGQGGHGRVPCARLVGVSGASLRFNSSEERDSLVQALQEARQQWAARYPEFLTRDWKN